MINYHKSPSILNHNFSVLSAEIWCKHDDAPQKKRCPWGTKDRLLCTFARSFLFLRISWVTSLFITSEHSHLFLFCWLLTAITVSGTNRYKELTLRECCNISHAWMNLKQRAWQILLQYVFVLNSSYKRSLTCIQIERSPERADGVRCDQLK